MSLLFNKKKLCAIALLLEEDEKISKKKRFGVHPMLKKRKEEGEYWTLYKELLEDETKFYGYFRMTKDQFQYILNKIQGCIKKENTSFKEAITPIEKLAVCLRFLATGDSLKTISYSFRLGHSTVHAIVIEVITAINLTMIDEYLPIPSQQKLKSVTEDFWKIWNFPNCIGAIDGKHVQIIAPANSGSLFFNYKKTFSVVLLALVDANYKFLAVDIGSYGKNSDGGIFQNSNLGKSLANNTFCKLEDKPLPGSDEKMPHVIVADEAFPLKNYIMRPYPGSQCDNLEKQHFNYRLSRARRVVENAFGILSQRFRIYNRRIQMKPEYVEKLILTTCILHNFIGVHLEQLRPNYNDTGLIGLPRHGGNNTLTAFTVRENFKNFFQSDHGKIDWQ